MCSVRAATAVPVKPSPAHAASAIAPLGSARRAAADPGQCDDGHAGEQQGATHVREMLGVFRSGRQTEKREPRDEHRDGNGVGGPEPKSEDEHRRQRRHPDAAGDCRLHDEERQRAQRDDRRDESDGVEGEPGEIRQLPSEPGEQHEVEVPRRRRSSRARRLQDRAEPVAHVGDERADQCEKHLRTRLRAHRPGALPAGRYLVLPEGSDAPCHCRRSSPTVTRSTGPAGTGAGEPAEGLSQLVGLRP